MSYAPQPGTIAYRAIEWLKTQPKTTQVTASVWAEAIGTDGTTLVGCLGTAMSSGLVLRHKRPDNVRLVWWSLGDGEPAEREPEVLPHRSEAPDVKPQPGSIFPGGVRGSEPVPPAPAPKPTPAPVTSALAHGGRPMTLSECGAAEEKPAKPTPFDVWFSGVSGELVIQGAHVDTDGDVVLPKEQVRQLLAALSGVAA